MDNTKCFICSLEMLSLAFTAAPSVAARLWVFLQSVLSSDTEKHTLLESSQVRSGGCDCAISLL